MHTINVTPIAIKHARKAMLHIHAAKAHENATKLLKRAVKGSIPESFGMPDELEYYGITADVQVAHQVARNPGTHRDVSDAELGAALSKMGLPEVMRKANELALQARAKATSNRGPTHRYYVRFRSESGLFVAFRSFK